jgi:hypothetical protein
VASTSVRLPSGPMANEDTAPSAKLVVKANRSSPVTAAQQISLRPLPSDLVTGVIVVPSTTYDETAAAPFSAPKASVTTSVPVEVNAKP